MTTSPLAEIFRLQAPREMAPLVADFGLESELLSGPQLALGAPSTWITLRWGSGHVADINVLVSPRNWRRRRPPAYESMAQGVFGLGVVLDAKARPEIAFSPRRLLTEDDVVAELKRIDSCLRNQGRELLDGSFEGWRGLQDLVDARLVEGQRVRRVGGPEEQAWRARREAAAAFGRGELEEALGGYESVADWLTGEERARVEYLKERSASR